MGLVADLIYPARCPLCDAFVDKNNTPCVDCVDRIQQITSDGYFPHLKKLWFERSLSAFAFDGVVRDAILALKYSERFDLVEYFVNELQESIQKLGHVDIVVPVPMHKKRLRQRGFNQAALIASRLAKVIGAVCNLKDLKRIKDVPSQTGLLRDERIENVKGVFVSASPVFDGKTVMVVDDVITTGSTVNECAKVLKKAGAKVVYAVGVARTL